MNYQHAYHAGNIADVFKHITLIQLLNYLKKKPNAFSYIETHAGKASYDLAMDPSQKTGEYQQGVYALWKNKAEVTAVAIRDYLTILAKLNPENTLKYYPGSGLIVNFCLREGDEASLCELHPAAYQDLDRYFHLHKSFHIHHRNGYEALPALIPPKPKRGLVLIDPPYEIKDEYQQIIQVLQKAHARWPQGVYAIWFPIKQYQAVLEFYEQIKSLAFPSVLAAEFWHMSETAEKTLKGSGLIMINPPWEFDSLLRTYLPDLIHALHLFEGRTSIIWLAKT